MPDPKDTPQEEAIKHNNHIIETSINTIQATLRPVQGDFFINKEQALADWCKRKGFFSKADIMQYGLDNFYLRADRTIRDFVQEGRARHLAPQECLFRGFKGKMGYYEFIK